MNAVIVTTLVLVGTLLLGGGSYVMYHVVKSCRKQQRQLEQHLNTPRAYSGQGTPVRMRPGHLGISSMVLEPSQIVERDLEGGRGDGESQRSDNAVREAAEWAQNILNTPRREPEKRERKKGYHTSIPVKETIYILQPDGESSLAMSDRLKDAMVQVSDFDLGISAGRKKMTGSFSRTQSIQRVESQELRMQNDSNTNNEDSNQQEEKPECGEEVDSSSKRKRRRRRRERMSDFSCQTIEDEVP